MLNYMRAEFYKAFRRKYTWISLLVMIVLEALLAGGFIFINANGSHVGFSESMVTMLQMFQIGFYATLLTGDIVFADQYKHSTLKNEVSFGIPRARIYLCKLAVQFALSVFYCVVMIAVYTAISWLVVYQDAAEGLAQAKRMTGYCLAVAFPLWAGAQALTCACMFLLHSSTAASFTAVGLLCIPGPVLQLMSLMNFAGRELCTKIYTWLPISILEKSTKLAGDAALLQKAWIVGAVWFAAATAAGLVGFHRREIK